MCGDYTYVWDVYVLFGIVRVFLHQLAIIIGTKFGFHKLTFARLQGVLKKKRLRDLRNGNALKAA